MLSLKFEIRIEGSNISGQSPTIFGRDCGTRDTPLFFGFLPKGGCLMKPSGEARIWIRIRLGEAAKERGDRLDWKYSKVKERYVSEVSTTTSTSATTIPYSTTPATQQRFITKATWKIPKGRRQKAEETAVKLVDLGKDNNRARWVPVYRGYRGCCGRRRRYGY